MRFTALIRSSLLTVAASALFFAPAASAGALLPQLNEAMPTQFAPAVYAPEMRNAGGITVTGTSDVNERTFDVRMSSPAIDNRATVRGLGARITLPADYATSGKRYPVVYLLHGAGASSYNFWHAISRGNIERLSANDAIIVMPDGGKNGWYTNWLAGIRQHWHTFHNDQLTAFVDANLRTIASRDGRAIAGVSMGGYGATRYAGDRPDLYTSVASLSGAVNQHSPALTTGVMGISAAMGLDGFGAFGAPWWPFDWHWKNANPSANPLRYKKVKTYVFIGNKNDPAEMIVRGATYDFVNALNRAKVPHYFENYGLGGRSADGQSATGAFCDGGHGTDCGIYALNKAFPMLMKDLTRAR